MRANVGRSPGRFEQEFKELKDIKFVKIYLDS